MRVRVRIRIGFRVRVRVRVRVCNHSKSCSAPHSTKRSDKGRCRN